MLVCCVCRSVCGVCYCVAVHFFLMIIYLMRTKSVTKVTANVLNKMKDQNLQEVEKLGVGR